MKKTALILALLLVTMTNAQKKNNKKIKGNGNQTTITRTTPEYEEISAKGSFKVTLVSGKEGTITLKGDENLLEYIETEVQDNILKIYTKKDFSFTGRENIVITVPFEKISAVGFAGSGDIETQDAINAEKLELKLAGSGDGVFAVNSSNLKVALAGSGDLKITGTTQELEAKLAGSGDVECSKLEAQNADVSVAGSGDLKVNCIKNLMARVAGSGDIYYKGKPESIDSKVAGSGNIASY